LVYNKYYVDELCDKVFVEGPVLGKGMGTALARFDLGVIDGVGVDGSAWLTRLTSRLSIWWDDWIVDGGINLLARIVWTLNWPARAIQTGLDGRGRGAVSALLRRTILECHFFILDEVRRWASLLTTS
ncbi:MAG: hypothetical protein ACE5HB_03875, partial [Terriglobia bacterium]